MKKILLLNLIPNTIGDNILLTPLFSILKKKIKDVKIDVTVSSLNAELFFNNPNLNKIIIIDELKYIADRKRARFSKFFIYLKILFKYSAIFKKEKYDTCFVLLPNFILNIFFPIFAGIKKKYGYTYKAANLSFILTKNTPYKGLETKDYERHFIESYLDLLRIADINFNKKEVVCDIFLTNKEERTFSKILKEKGLTKKKYICFQAGSKGNAWDVKNFIALSKQLLKRYPYKLVLLGSKSEHELNKQISDLDNKIINLCMNTSLREKAFLLKNSVLSVCNDSGLAHMSSTMGTRTIVLYGPTSPKHSIPFGRGKVYPIYKYYNEFPYLERCTPEGLMRINKIKPEEVFEKVKEILN